MPELRHGLSSSPSPARSSRKQRIDVAAVLLAITLLGAVLRLVNLTGLPPGAYLDETIPNIIARDALATGHFQIYYPESFGGYHPEVVYTAILWRWLTGGSPYALRFGIAAWSILSLPLFFLTLRAIFRLDEPPWRADWLALAGTLIAALVVAYIINSRNALENTLPLPAAAATFLFLALGLRSGRRRYLVLAGLALGLAQYTALSARFLPLAVTAALAWLAIAQGRAPEGGRPAWRARAIDLAIVAGASVVAALPFLLYFAPHPEQFIARAALTTTDTGQAGQAGLAGLIAFLLNSTWRTLGGLALPGFGDVLPRQNVPGRPLFDAFLALCLVLGVILATLRPRRPSRILLASWAAVMLLPAIFTLVNNAPHFTRMIVAVPALAGLAALGAAALRDVLGARNRWLAAGLLAAGLCFSTAATVQAVFVEWPRVPALDVDFLVADWQAANLALARSASQDVFLSPDLISRSDHTTFDLLLRGGPVRDFPGPTCLIYPASSDRPTTYIILAPSDPRTADRLTALFPAIHQDPAILHGPGQWADYLVYQVPAGAAARPPQHFANALFGDKLSLAGYDLSAAAVRPGDTLTVTLYWQALQPALPEYSMFIHLYLPGGDVGAPGVAPQPLAQNDGAACRQSFPTTRWQPGEMVVDERTLTVPGNYTAATAPLGLGVYAWPSLERLPPAGQVNLLPDNRVSLGEIEVVPGAQNTLSIR